MKRGPYVNADGDELSLPVADYTWNEARHEAASLAQEMNGDQERTRYIGKRTWQLHDHEEPWNDDECGSEPCYVFELYEGTWR